MHRTRHAIGGVWVAFTMIGYGVAPMNSWVASGELLQGAQTIWSGVYTESQADRGGKTYQAVCSTCHRVNLSGGDGPPLTGPTFMSLWRDVPVSDLFLTIGNTMPENAPASLSAGEVIDIVSFILKANGAAAGGADLPPDLDTLKQIRITLKP